MDGGVESALLDLLERQIAVAAELAQLLGSERTALTGTSPEAVAASAAGKISLLDRLERIESERRRAFAAAGLGDSAPDRARDSVPVPVAQRWQALLRLAADCRRANEANGYLIRARQQQVRQLLDALRGGSPGTYGPRGIASTATPRTLAQV